MESVLIHQPNARSLGAWRALALCCILLTLFAAVAQTNHVHKAGSNSPDHECSLCLVAHSTAFIAPSIEPKPVSTPSILESAQKTTPKPFQPISSHYIRPPPSV